MLEEKLRVEVECISHEKPRGNIYISLPYLPADAVWTLGSSVAAYKAEAGVW